MFSLLSFGSKSLRFAVNALAIFCKSIFDGIVFPDSNSIILSPGMSVLFEISSSERLEISLKYFRSADVDFSTVEKSRALTANLRDLLPNDKSENKVIVKHHDEGKKWFYPNQTSAYEFIVLANTTTLPYSKSFEIKINNVDNNELDLRAGLHQYVYNIGNNTITINWVLDGQIFSEKIHPNDSLCIKPFVEHNFRGEGKLLVLRIGGKIVGDSQRELSFVGGNQEMMVDGKTGFLVEQGNHQQLIDKFSLLLEDKELSKKMGNNGRKFIEDTFNWEIVTKNFIKNIESYLK